MITHRVSCAGISSDNYIATTTKDIVWVSTVNEWVLLMARKGDTFPDDNIEYLEEEPVAVLGKGRFWGMDGYYGKLYRADSGDYWSLVYSLDGQLHSLKFVSWPKYAILSQSRIVADHPRPFYYPLIFKWETENTYVLVVNDADKKVWLLTTPDLQVVFKQMIYTSYMLENNDEVLTQARSLDNPQMTLKDYLIFSSHLNMENIGYEDGFLSF